MKNKKRSDHSKKHHYPNVHPYEKGPKGDNTDYSEVQHLILCIRLSVVHAGMSRNRQLGSPTLKTAAKETM